MSLKINVQGDWNTTKKFLDKAKGVFKKYSFDDYGKMGVEALRANTPIDTGSTANSWYYKIERDGKGVTINWLNRNVNKGVVIAVILQYGHGTGNGGYVRGTDYINPAMRNIFQKIADDMWREVTE